MYKLLFSTLLLGANLATMAQSSVVDVSKALKALSPYETKLTISAQGESLSGGYQVDGEQIYLYLDGGVEFYSDGNIRYQVDGSNRTVIIENFSQGEESTLLDNPTTAFDTVLEVYDEALISKDANQCIIQLSLKSGEDSMIDSILLVVDSGNSLPKSINYSSDGQSITIDFITIKPLKGEIRRFLQDSYPDYEVVDFR